MYKYFVLLDTINKVKEFVNLSQRIDSKVYLQHNEYVVDAKSIMGIFSLDLSKPCCFMVEKELNEEIYKELKKYMIE